MLIFYIPIVANNASDTLFKVKIPIQIKELKKKHVLKNLSCWVTKRLVTALTAETSIISVFNAEVLCAPDEGRRSSSEIHAHTHAYIYTL